MNYEYCDGMTYTIKKGDTLYEISRKHNVALSLLLRANPYIDVFNLQVGDTICIPTTPQPAPTVNRESTQSMDDEFAQGVDELRQDIDEDMAEENVPAGSWEKYVVQPGDTLEDVLRGMNGDAERFLEKNSPAGIYMLPGVAYYVFVEEDEK